MDEIKFGPFTFRIGELRLLRDGEALGLTRQPALVLKVLLENSGHCVPHAEMARLAWGLETVERHTLAVQIAAIKKCLKEFGRWIRTDRQGGYGLFVTGTAGWLKRGWLCWGRRTREGFEKALDCFRRAADIDGSSAQAYAGMAVSHLMLGTYAMRPPNEAYPSFCEAHSRAVALGGATPELRVGRAHGLHIFERRFEEAESELLRVKREAPEVVTVYVALTMLYASTRRFDEGLQALEQARVADPFWPTLAALKIFVHYLARDFASAVQSGSDAFDLYPYLHLGRAYYAQALEYSGRVEEALHEYRLNRTFAPDVRWLRALEGSCLARCGRDGDAKLILSELEALRRTEYVDAYFMAVLREAMSDRLGALAEIDRALEENSATLFILDVDPQMDPLRCEPRFAAVRSKLFDRSIGTAA